MKSFPNLLIPNYMHFFLTKSSTFFIAFADYQPINITVINSFYRFLLISIQKRCLIKVIYLYFIIINITYTFSATTLELYLVL